MKHVGYCEANTLLHLLLLLLLKSGIVRKASVSDWMVSPFMQH